MFRLSLFLLLTMSLFGCSRIRMAYDWADTAILWRMDDYFDIDSNQKAKAKVIVRRELREILEHESPKWVSFLKKLATHAAKAEVSIEDYTKDREQLISLYWDLSERLVPAAQSLALELKPRQFDYFKTYTENEAKKALTGSKIEENDQARDRLKRFLDFLNIDLNSEQEKLLTDHLKNTARPAQEYFANRQEFVQKFLNASKKPDDLKIYIKNLLSRGPNDLRSKDRIEAMRKYQASGIKFEFEMLKLMSPRQRDKLQNRLLDVAEQIETLRKREISTPSMEPVKSL